MKYLINGMTGAGKSTLGEELSRRGYKVIEADSEEKLSSWVNKKTGAKAKHEPPFSQEWLNEHVWQWDEVELKKILSDTGGENIFIVGGADNEDQFLDLFDKIFIIHIDTPTMKSRLQSREPERWPDDGPELARMIEWNKHFFKYVPKGKNVILIDGGQPIEKSVNKIVEIVSGS